MEGLIGRMFKKKRTTDIHLPATTEKGIKKEESLGIRPAKGLFAQMRAGKKTIDEMASNSKKMSPEMEEEAKKKSREFFMNVGRKKQ